ncbi:MAG: (4Fe-4S)-binding protein [bacterium]|nr:(4Fe-4S)-binding protein [bacterium]
MKKTKEIVIISGKGGTGKTTITASLASMLPADPGNIIVDTDVDASNLHLLLKPWNIDSRDFNGKDIAFINPFLCVGCNRCRELCRFDAIEVVEGHYHVVPFSCEGCSLCNYACPKMAVEMNERIVGKWFTCDTNFGELLHARLIPGAENSGSLVAMVKQQAILRAKEKQSPVILIDGPPGIGCPVIAAVSGADLAIIVTEPTLSAFSDLERVFKLASHFGVPCGIVINRVDINRENAAKIRTFATVNNIDIFAEIPHSRCVVNEISMGNLPMRNCKSFYTQVKRIYERINLVIQ